MSNSIQAKLPFQNALSQSWMGLDPGNKLTVGFVLLPFFYQQKRYFYCMHNKLDGQNSHLTQGGKKKNKP
jgi:hypothetical protein